MCKTSAPEPCKMKGRRKKLVKILSFFLKKDMKSMSIFTFRKKMLTKKNHFFGFSTFLRTPYGTCFGIFARSSGRVHKKNAKKPRIWADLGSLFGEMERHEIGATCEHNYGATFF